MELVLAGEKLPDGTQEKALITHFELLNLVPIHKKIPTHPLKSTQESHSADFYRQQSEDEANSYNSDLTKWRRVGLVSGSTVHLDTIVWPGGDIVVSGLAARARSVFRVVTALAPPFVMVSELDEDGLCLRGLLCHRLAATGWLIAQWLNETDWTQCHSCF